jgi:hypothetical protein
MHRVPEATSLAVTTVVGITVRKNMYSQNVVTSH